MAQLGESPTTTPTIVIPGSESHETLCSKSVSTAIVKTLEDSRLISARVHLQKSKKPTEPIRSNSVKAKHKILVSFLLFFNRSILFARQNLDNKILIKGRKVNLSCHPLHPHLWEPTYHRTHLLTLEKEL